MSSTGAFALLALTLVWLLRMEIYPDYRADLLRERLAAARQRLFDLAREGALSLDHPSIRYLDSRLRRAASCAGGLSFARLALHGMRSGLRPVEPPTPRDGPCLALEREMNAAIAWHLASGFIPLWLWMAAQTLLHPDRPPERSVPCFAAVDLLLDSDD